MSRLFIFITLFLTLSLAWFAQSAPATNYPEGCPPATLKEPTVQIQFPSDRSNRHEFIYFSQDSSNPFEARKCDYCGGMSDSCCATVCGCMGYRYYRCLECQCGCGN
ncbi:unnamed protein product [Rhizophagus irregularis]|uniref:Uncharacterized protein n=1 Tax=Rhizophagus irregularis TaxID=588596 RepID=A0A2I1GTU1_9GLOM|nr:hypothetical protein RhiirA4_457463 [Rhizophagus irregularis]PKY50037.1 hypothetical protein RhiirA4_466279 [Rhizophagus irregularis]CAB4435383.1 unnamed protein product [Rhizophagus irregularis]